MDASNITDGDRRAAVEVVRRFDGVELRRYPSHVIAEAITELPFAQAGNNAFGFLFGYIDGQNRSKSSVAMTGPVTLRSMQEGGYTVAFVRPASMTAQGAPEPTIPNVTIRTVQPSLAAAARHSG
jgi:SOUL heme-binding protein